MSTAATTRIRRADIRKSVKASGGPQREYRWTMRMLQELEGLLKILDFLLTSDEAGTPGTIGTHGTPGTIGNQAHGFSGNGARVDGQLLQSVLDRLAESGHACPPTDTVGRDFDEVARYLREQFFIQALGKGRGTIRFRERQVVALRSARIRLEYFHRPLERAARQLFQSRKDGLEVLEKMWSQLADEAEDLGSWVSLPSHEPRPGSRSAGEVTVAQLV